jgi:shikimate kinase
MHSSIYNDASLVMHPDDLQPTSKTLQRIVLVGFMGAGKSTVGALLAERLGWRFIDVDLYLEAKSGLSVSQIFLDMGEPAFRRLEAETVAELQAQSHIILALGGGALEADSTRALLHRDGGTFLVFLQAGLDVLVDRCEKQINAATRPVLQQRNTLHERFQARLKHYEEAHLTVSTEGLRPASVADEICARLMIVPFNRDSSTPSAKERAII